MNFFSQKSKVGGRKSDVRRPIFVLWLLVSGFWFLLCANGRAQAPQERPADYQIKAAFLEKFCKFIEWPSGAFADARAPLNIGVFGDDPFHGSLETFAGKDTVDGRAIHVITIKALTDLKSCQIIYIPAVLKAQEREIVDAVKGQAILTVGDANDFYDVGGMIQFVIEEQQVHFEINDEAARAAGLKISSKLLMLAKHP